MTLKWYHDAKNWREERGHTTQDWKEYINWTQTWISILITFYFLTGFFLGMKYANL